jgi:hypothetical protein
MIDRGKIFAMKENNSDREKMGWSWEDARIIRRLESASWPMSKKLAWIESASKLARNISRGRQKLIEGQDLQK